MYPGTTAAAIGILSWIDVQSLSLGGLIGAYVQWLREAESFDNRRTTIRETLEGTKSSRSPESFLVESVNFIEEKDSWKYRLRKFVPFLRSLKGRTKLTIRSIGPISRTYVWAPEENRPDFTSYLKEVCSEDYPLVKVVHPDLNAESSANIPELQLEIESIDMTELSKVVDQTSKFHEYYYNNYPGDERFRLPY